MEESSVHEVPWILDILFQLVLFLNTWEYFLSTWEGYKGTALFLWHF